MNDSFGKRLQKARKHAGFKTAEEAIERFGWNKHTYKAHEGGSRAPKNDGGEIYAKAFKVRAEWLLLNSGEMLSEGNGLTSSDIKQKKNYQQPIVESVSITPLNMLDTIPLYGPASAGSEKVYLTEDSVIGEEVRPPALQGVRGGFMMLVAGDCMEPRMFRGNKLWVHPYHKPLPTDDCIVVMKEDGNATVKEYVSETATEVKLTQLNPKKNITIKKADIEKMFVVVGIQRR